MTKQLLAIVLCLIVLPAAAQKFGGFDAGDVSTIMSQAGEIKECLSKVDQNELQAAQAEAEAAQKTVAGLCADDKREEAQSTAVAFGKELAEKPVVKEVQACAGLADQTIPQLAWAQLEDSDQVENHVCDIS